METILQMKGIVKSFLKVEVLHGVDFELKKGEIHALIGENGAGKSTLMNILMGVLTADAGQILLNGCEVCFSSPQKALEAGVAMIHQELSPVPDMTVYENFYLGREIRNFGIVNDKIQREKTIQELHSLGLEVNPDTKMRQLSVSETQMVEIAKTLSYGSRIIIMDEPTSAIAESEVQRFFETICLLKSKGVSIIYISHKIEELFEIADRITVLRDGFKVGSGIIDDLTKQDIITMMVGRELTEVFPKIENKIGDTVLSVRNLKRQGEFDNISFDLHKGEILGIAGLRGAGRTELVTTIFGERKLEHGEILIKGKAVSIHNTHDAVKHKIALVPEDRKLHGLNLIGSVLDNVMMVIQKKMSNVGVINTQRNIKAVNSSISKLSIKARNYNQRVGSLSGGNQQKVVLAKWLMDEPEIIILDDPTRGIDVGAKTEIYKLVNDLAHAGKSIIMTSSELSEIIGLCDRVLVLCEGKITGELGRNELTQERIMALASGTKEAV